MTPPPPRILIADDDLDTRSTIGCLLTAMELTNYREATDGKQALEALEEEDFDLFICDWIMPGVNGIDILKRIRADKRLRALPFIMVTAETRERDITEAYRCGADEFVVKPFSLDILEERIRQCLNKP